MSASIQSSTDLVVNAQRYLDRQLAGRPVDPQLRAAWTEFFDIYDRMIRRLLLVRGVPSAHRDDLAQEVWLAVLRQAVDVPVSPSLFRAWLGAVVRNKVLNLVGRGKAYVHVDMESLACEDEFRTLWEREFVEVMLVHLSERVSSEAFTAFYARRIEGESIKEIACQLGLSERQLRKTIHRTRRTFRRLWKFYAKEHRGV